MTSQLSFPHRSAAFCVALLLLAVLNPSSGFSQTAFLGYSDSLTVLERQREARLSERIKPEELDSLVKFLASENRIAGSESDHRVAMRSAKMLEDAGLSVITYPYHVYLPYATTVSLEMTSPIKKKFILKEKIYPGETKANGPEYPWANGYSGTGAVQAPVIFVNYGLQADYTALDSVHVSVKDRIVIARYGRSYRGIKARLAEEHGAVGLLLYNDPGGDGYATGDAYPDGAARSMDGIQRGSVYNGHGDPTTPGYASTLDAPHVSPDSGEVLAKIPVMPISAAIAQEILSAMNPSAIPENGWQGYLPLRYHLGGELPIVKLTVQTDGKSRDIWNTVGTVTGSELPNEWIIVGGHRDAWGPGAEDNGSGAAAVIAAARAVAALAHEGIRPKRSILFALWDAEEWGLIGSTEFVEQFGRELTSRALLYINEDECATGHHFDASADPLLRSFVWDVTASIADPSGGSIYDRWKANWTAGLKPENVVGRPPIGLLGGGSDFTSFNGHIGVPSINQGFDGPFGQYHSEHDSYYYVKHFGDTSFVYHALIAKLMAVEALRMANAEILPYDYGELASSIQLFAHNLSLETPKAWADSEKFVTLDTALSRMKAAATTMNQMLANSSAMSLGVRHQLNQQLRKLIYVFVPIGGIPNDPWTHDQLVTSDPGNGYADLTLPGLHASLKKNAQQEFDDQLLALTASTEGATREIASLTQLFLKGK